MEDRFEVKTGRELTDILKEGAKWTRRLLSSPNKVRRPRTKNTSVNEEAYRLSPLYFFGEE